MVRVGETVLTAAAGAAIGLITGWGVDAWLGFDWAPVVGSVIGGLNGLIMGARRGYDWRDSRGWLAFALDSSWAIVGSAQAVVAGTYNALMPGSEFSPEYSVRRNRQVFGRGFRLRRTFATTFGNVITNARLGRRAPIGDRHGLIERHEGLHVWQQRWFGPLYPLTYLVVGAVGGLVGLAFGLVSRERRRRGVGIGKLIETAAYYDNPFEIWAYRNDGRWDENGAHPVLKWGVFRWPPDEEHRA